MKQLASQIKCKHYRGSTDWVQFIRQQPYKQKQGNAGFDTRLINLGIVERKNGNCGNLAEPSFGTRPASMM